MKKMITATLNRLCANHIFAIMTAIVCSYLVAFAAAKFGMSVYSSSVDYAIDYFVIHPILILAVYIGTTTIYSVFLKKLSQNKMLENGCIGCFIFGLLFFAWLHTRKMLNKYSFCIIILQLCVGSFSFRSFAVPQSIAPELFMFAVALSYFCIPVFIYNLCNLFLTFKSDDYMPKTKPILGMLISASIWILLKTIL